MRTALAASGLLLLAACSARSAELYGLLREGGHNLLANPDFEQIDDVVPASWRPWEAGAQAAPGEGRGGGTAARCTRGAGDVPQTGINQSLTLDQTRPLPLVVTAWSKAEGVTGGPDPDYSIYCDLIYTDGTPSWGHITPFAVGTHDWQKQKVTIVPDKPIRQIVVHLLLRRHQGTVWFDDAACYQIGAEVATLDMLAVAPQAVPPSGPAETHRAGPLEVTLQGQRVSRVTLGGKDLTGPNPGGFLARDVAADSGLHGFDDGRCDALGLALEAQVTAAADHLAIDGTLRDLSGKPRAVTLSFALPVDALGWRWGQDVRTTSTIDERGAYQNWAGIGCGSNGQLSIYPLANVAGPSGGLNLAIDMKRPAHYRLGCSAGARLFYIAFDFGLTPDSKRHPSAAPFHFVVYPSDAAWGFRAGLADYYRLYPDSFTMRTPQQGIWMAFAKTSEVQDWQDFGFRFKEGNNETAWDDEHGILTFRYSEMGSFWMSMPKDMPREREVALKLLQQIADNPNEPRHRFAQAVLTAGLRDANDDLLLSFVEAPWCDGALFMMNPSPNLPGEVTGASLHWNDQAKAAYAEGASPALDGEYLDSLEGFAPEDPSPSHVANAEVPPTFDSRTMQPTVQIGFAKAEFVAQIGDWLHDHGKLLMANSVPYRFGFLTARIDLMGTETNWMEGTDYRPDGDGIMNLRRAMAGKRPYLLLLNTHFEDFGPYVERYFQRALAYGMLPSMFSYNAANDHYFTKPEWYNRDRELFKHYQPRIRELAEEGWEPITGARCDNPAIQLERFGPGPTKRIFLTAHNPTNQEQAGGITFEAGIFGPDKAAQEVTLAPWETKVL